eukprot:874515-Pleurochrysis_carterae.AAC.1
MKGSYLTIYLLGVKAQVLARNALSRAHDGYLRRHDRSQAGVTGAALTGLKCAVRAAGRAAGQ